MWSEDPVDWHFYEHLFLFRQKYIDLHDFSKWTHPVKNSSLVSILWLYMLFQIPCFPSTSSRAKNRSKFPPANPWAHGRGQVRHESLFHFLTLFITRMSSLKHERRSKVSQMPNFTFTDISFCDVCFHFCSLTAQIHDNSCLERSFVWIYFFDQMSFLSFRCMKLWRKKLQMFLMLLSMIL